jgi:hypothetical protein
MTARTLRRTSMGAQQIVRAVIAQGPHVPMEPFFSALKTDAADNDAAPAGSGHRCSTILAPLSFSRRFSLGSPTTRVTS